MILYGSLDSCHEESFINLFLNFSYPQTLLLANKKSPTFLRGLLLSYYTITFQV